MSDVPFARIDSETLYEGKIFTVRRDTFRHDDGGEFWVGRYAHHIDSVRAECGSQRRTPAPGPLDGLQDLPLDGGPGEFRARLHAALSRARVSESEARDMIVAAGEVLANAQQHGGGLVAVQVGRVDGRFVCEVADDGVGVDDPLAGFLPPRPNTGDGAGLWVARQLTRELELVPRPDGFSVRLWAAAAA